MPRIASVESALKTAAPAAAFATAATGGPTVTTGGTTANGGSGQDFQIGKDGTVTLDPAASHRWTWGPRGCA